MRWYRSAESTGRQSQLPALHSEMAKKNDGQGRTVDRLEGAPDVRLQTLSDQSITSLSHCSAQ